MISPSHAKQTVNRITRAALAPARKASVALRRALSTQLVRLGARSRRPSAVALGLRLGTRARAHHSGWRTGGHGGAVEILAVKNAGLVSDLDAAFVDSPDVRLSFIPGELWRDIGREFLSPPLGDFRQEAHRERHPDEHERLVGFLVEVCRRYFARRPFAAVIAGNFTHWANHDLGLALGALEKPFLVLHKEGLVSAWPSVAAEYSAAVTGGVGATTAGAVLVHSDDTARLLASCGVAPEEQIHVVGTVRLDACHAHRRRRAVLPARRWGRITFFTFWPHVGIHLNSRNASTAHQPDRVGWSQTLDEVLHVAESLARSFPQTEIVVKSKAAVARLPGVATPLQSLAQRAPSNLRVVSKNEGQDLVLSSDAIVALNSTVLLEAIAAGVPAFVPTFGQQDTANLAANLLDLRGAAHSSQSADELLQSLEEICSGPVAPPAAELHESAVRALRRYGGNPDGESTRRLRQLLDEAIGATP